MAPGGDALPKDFTLEIRHSNRVIAKTRIANSTGYALNQGTETSSPTEYSFSWVAVLDPDLEAGDTVEVWLKRASDFPGPSLGQVRGLRAWSEELAGSDKIVVEWERPVAHSVSDLPGSVTEYRVELWGDFLMHHQTVTVDHHLAAVPFSTMLDVPETTGGTLYSVWVTPYYGDEVGESIFAYVYGPE